MSLVLGPFLGGEKSSIVELLTEREQTCMDKTFTANTGVRQPRSDNEVVGDFDGDIKNVPPCRITAPVPQRFGHVHAVC